jgi:mRNA-degrading endonuclease toxin of MazEF toxin-antitoxin module
MFDFGMDDQGDAIISSCILNQAKVIDNRRFVKKIGILPEEEFVIIKEKLQRLLFETF